MSGEPPVPARAERSVPRARPYHRKRPILTPGTFPDLPDHIRVGFGERAVADLGAHQLLRIVGATRGVIDHAVGDAVHGVR